MRKLYGLLFLSLFGVLNQTQAQTQVEASQRTAGAKLTLQECVDIALKNNIQIKQGMLQIESNQNNLMQSRYNRYPNLNGNVGQGFSFGRGIDPFTNSYISQQINYNNFGLSSGITIYSGGQLQNTIKQNELNLRASREDVQSTRDNISLNIAGAYLNILNNEDLVSIARAQSEQTRRQIERVEKLVKAGSLPETNLLDLQAQLANDELSIVNNQNALDAAKLQLLQLMNLNPNQDIQLDRIAINTTLQNYDATPQQVYDVAVGTQANIKAAELRIKGAEVGIDLAKGALYPTLSFSGSLSTNYSSAAKRAIVGEPVNVTTTANVIFQGQSVPIQFVTQQPSVSYEPIQYFTQLNSNQNKNIGFNLRIPIFNGFQAKTRIANSLLNKKNLEYQAEISKQQLRQNIETAYNNMLAAAKRYSATQKQVNSLELAFKASETRFNLGALNSVDYNLAKTNLDRARANLVQAKYEYVFRTKILDYYQNKPLTL
ncbi:MAG: TolC family protein [Spirosomataceae bacterium]